MDIQEIELALLEVVQTYAGQLPAQQAKDMADLVRAGEPGIAFENLCTQLYEYHIAVDNGMLNKLSDIGSAMGLHSKYWHRLKLTRSC